MEDRENEHFTAAENSTRYELPPTGIVRELDLGTVRAVMVDLDAGPEADLERDLTNLANAVSKIRTPVILAVTGSGTVPLELVEASDICFAEPGVSIVSDEVKVTAAEAEESGLLNGVIEGKARETAEEMAENMSALAPKALAACKKAVRDGLQMELEAGLRLESDLFCEIFSTRDMKEGTSAFLEKRKAAFSGE